MKFHNKKSALLKIQIFMYSYSWKVEKNWLLIKLFQIVFKMKYLWILTIYAIPKFCFLFISYFEIFQNFKISENFFLFIFSICPFVVSRIKYYLTTKGQNFLVILSFTARGDWAKSCSPRITFVSIPLRHRFAPAQN